MYAAPADQRQRDFNRCRSCHETQAARSEAEAIREGQALRRVPHRVHFVRCHRTSGGTEGNERAAQGERENILGESGNCCTECAEREKRRVKPARIISVEQRAVRQLEQGCAQEKRARGKSQPGSAEFQLANQVRRDDGVDRTENGNDKIAEGKRYENAHKNDFGHLKPPVIWWISPLTALK